MNWIKYLLEANLYLALFYAAYYLLMRRDTHYQMGRAYLLSSSVLAFVIPVLQLGFLKPDLNLITTNPTPTYPIIIHQTTSATTTAVIPLTAPTEPLNYYLITYTVVAVLMTIALSFRIIQLFRLSRKGKAELSGDIKMIKFGDGDHAFSFFGYLFISDKLASSPAVVQHELVHIRQKHSLDVLWLELLKIICWFNPVIYLLQRNVKELHEYIADSVVASADEDLNNYTDLLIRNAYGLPAVSLTNNFYTKNLLKNRIMMLHQKRSGSLAKLKYLIALPLMTGMLCVSTLGFSKDYEVFDIAPKKVKKKATKYPAVTAPAINIDQAENIAEILANVSRIPQPDTDKVVDKLQRGKTYIRGIAEPASALYIVDDVEINKDNAAKYGLDDLAGNKSIIGVLDKNIGQDNIASMEVLKPTDGEAIYGSKGKNGVIKITTKKGMVKTDNEPPLVYVDGEIFPYNAKDVSVDTQGKIKGVLSMVPQETIASVEVFNPTEGEKTYGAKGAHGVVLITTHRGKTIQATAEAARKDSLSVTGISQLYKYLLNNIKYPAAAKEAYIQGKVFIVFKINDANKIDSWKVLRGLSDDIHAEVVRVLKQWTAPDGIRKDVTYTIPISFSLHRQDGGDVPAPTAKIVLNGPTEENPHTGFGNSSLMMKETVVRGYIK